MTSELTTNEIATTAREDARNSFAADVDPSDQIAELAGRNGPAYDSDEYRDAFLAEWKAIAEERARRF